MSNKVPYGKYEGKDKSEVPDWYITSVCNKRSKYFSFELAKFFADDMARIIKERQSGMTVKKLPTLGEPRATIRPARKRNRR